MIRALVRHRMLAEGRPLTGTSHMDEVTPLPCYMVRTYIRNYDALCHNAHANKKWEQRAELCDPRQHII